MAAALLVGAGVVALLGGEDAGEPPPAECLAAWNEDSLALSDGVHASAAHSYGETLIAFADGDGVIVTDASAGARCAVVFATPKVEFEPAFGVRVFTGGRWIGLADADGVSNDQISAIQRAATETANATLLPDGRLAPG